MPFTFGHPAIVLPFLKKRYFSASGLIAGSMTPDFEYFFRMKMVGNHGHTLAGLFYFDVPTGILMLVLYFYLVREPLINNLPAAISQRMYLFRFDWSAAFRKHWAILLLSILAGAATHIFWDSFTHNSTLFTSNIPILRIQLFMFFEDYPAYHILQHVSTGVGLSVVITSFFCLPVIKFQPIRSRGYWPGIMVVAALIFAIRIAFIYEEIKIGHVVVIGIASAMYSLILISAIYKFRYPG